MKFRRKKVLITIKVDFLIINCLSIIKTFFYHIEIKKGLWLIYKPIIFIVDQNAGLGDGISEAWRRSEKHWDDFKGLGDRSANQEASEVISRGSWRLCIPSLGTMRWSVDLVRVIMFIIEIKILHEEKSTNMLDYHDVD